MDYEAFKRDLIDTLDLEKTEMITKSCLTKQSLDPIFVISSTDDKLYKRLIEKFQRTVFSKIQELCVSLCEEHKLDYIFDGSYLFCPINGIKSKVIFEVSSLAMVPDTFRRFKLDKSTSSSEFTPTIVFLQNDSLEGRRMQQRCQQNVRWFSGFEILLFSDFLELTFGQNEKKAFYASMRGFNDQIREALGYQITELCSPQNLEVFKSLCDIELQTFDYDKAKNNALTLAQAKNQNAKDLYWGKYDEIKKQFIAKKRYKVLLGSKDYADSFISSEWLFHKYENTTRLDNTYKVAGYFKSIEQLLWRIVFLLGSGRNISGKNGSSVEVSITNDALINKTLGSLQYFLTNYSNSDLFSDAFGEGKRFVINYLGMLISLWREKNRNGYFHKDNLQDLDKVIQIREQTLFLYMVILGSLNLSDEILEELS